MAVLPCMLPSRCCCCSFLYFTIISVQGGAGANFDKIFYLFNARDFRSNESFYKLGTVSAAADEFSSTKQRNAIRFL